MTDHIDTAQERKRLRTQAWGLLPRLAHVRVGDLLDALDAARARAEKAEDERDQALARLAAAYEAAAKLSEASAERNKTCPSGCRCADGWHIATRIRALTPADAEAALQRVVDAAWNEALDEAVKFVEGSHKYHMRDPDDIVAVRFAAAKIRALKRPEASHE